MVDLLLLGMGLLTNPIVLVTLMVATVLSNASIAVWMLERQPRSVGLKIGFFFLLITVVIVLVAAATITVDLLIGHAATHWPIRKYGVLLAATYAAGSGAPYWSGRNTGGPMDDGVIRLPIPEQLSTLSFTATTEIRRTAVDAARDATSIRLMTILGRVREADDEGQPQ